MNFTCKGFNKWRINLRVIILHWMTLDWEFSLLVNVNIQSIGLYLYSQYYCNKNYFDSSLKRNTFC